MINAVMSAISEALYREFGEGYHIYIGEVRQGLDEPCFLITSPNNEKRLFHDRRYLTRNLFTIYYFPSDIDARETEFNDVAERMYDCLEVINDDDPIRGTDMNARETNDTLAFMVNYNMFMMDTTTADPLESLEQSIHPRE